ncbi:MAG: dgoD [Firmicutes bacterium]|nr:dgoD [Bacillota bacterium]MBP2639811.1 dgoD [Bacillota bacterium]
MKITSVEVIKVATPFKPDTSTWQPIVVRVNTDEGISGYGELGMAYGIGYTAGFGMCQDLARIIIGMDPRNNEEIWEKMLKKTFWGQGGGTVIFSGMSALDTALWDIKGKVLNTPLYQLLGGKTNKKLRAYASQLQFGWGLGKDKQSLNHPKEYADIALQAVEMGFDAVKVDPIGFDKNGVWRAMDLTGTLPQDHVELAYQRVKAIREAVGSGVDIIVEMHAMTDTTAAIQFGRRIEDLNIMYYEEPTMSLNPDQMKQIATSVRVPIAAGERIYSRWGYRPFFHNGSIQMIQPDVGNCGGITEGKKICDMAHVYDVKVQAHVCGGPIATAVALHLEAAIPNFMIHETHRYSLLEGNICTCKYDYQPENGYYEVPELPGIGQELDEDVVKKSFIEKVS